MIKGNAVIGQSGGPTSVINASLAGVLEQLKNTEKIESLYGMHYGIEGFINEWLINLQEQDAVVLDGLKYTPSSALGSSRYKLKNNDFPLILKILRKYNIRYFFLIGSTLLVAFILIASITLLGVKDSNKQMLQELESVLKAVHSALVDRNELKYIDDEFTMVKKVLKL